MGNCLRFFTVLITMMTLTVAATANHRLFIKSGAPELLTYNELKKLSLPEPLAPPLAVKLERLLTTAFISNEAYYQGVQPRQPEHKRLGPLLRTFSWNIERGHRLDDIMLAFTAPEKFINKVKVQMPEAELAALESGLQMLGTIDLLALTELDMGMPRTGYRDVTRELAAALGMNYAYGVEFVEVAPFQFEQVRSRDEESRYLGLHGSAVLSRYPIRSAKVYRYSYQPFDWFEGNLVPYDDSVDTAKKMFGGFIGQKSGPKQLRRGSRMMLVVDLEVAHLPEQVVTVVVTHLESSASPDGRRMMMREALQYLQSIKNPVILAGDLNTSGVDRARRWQGQRPLPATAPIEPVRGALGELAVPERELLWEVARLKFADGRYFDFRGDAERSTGGRTGILANSNEAAEFGYVPTLEVPGLLGAFGKFKLDWIFVKAYLDAPLDERGSYRFAPHYGKTLTIFNQLKDRLSDHTPLMVDLPLTEPKK